MANPPISQKARAKDYDTETGLVFERHFTKSLPSNHTVFDLFNWKKFDAVIRNSKGEESFRQEGVSFPDFFSQESVNIVVTRYFRGPLNTPERETSFRDVVYRVVSAISKWGVEQGYFSFEDSGLFFDELAFLILSQRLSFNSPVWFNVGVEEKAQCSACFIQSVDDDLESILDLAKKEGMVFKYGSGTGTNFSTLRSSYEGLSGGGLSSGVMSWLEILDTGAKGIKSGGKTRRAAKMVVLDMDHPDIFEQRDGNVGFIGWKAHEEEKARVLEAAGYSGGIEGEAVRTVQGQNANNSVRVTDEFMDAVKNDGSWTTYAVTTGEPVHTYKARDLWQAVAESAWQCGDPGVQFDTTINDWHTCPNTDRINASNPCSEYMFLDNSACNLASLNLLKFSTGRDEFDIQGFQHAVDILFTAMEIIVDGAHYPNYNPAIGENSRRFRPLGLGFGNLGALLMSWGIPYDSDAGRAVAASISALMCGRAYRQSAIMADFKGPFEGFQENRDPMLNVISKHAQACRDIPSKWGSKNGTYHLQHAAEPIQHAAEMDFAEAWGIGSVSGFRNSQATLIAPTGTISFMMGFDTTGVEPAISLVSYKTTVGGGYHKMPIKVVAEALHSLGYLVPRVEDALAYIDANDTFEGWDGFNDPEKEIRIFDTALPGGGKRYISVDGHMLMMAAIQPFMSGAISKTVNMPVESTVEDIMNAYEKGWELGLKSVALYRDGSKTAQPVSAKRKEQIASRSERERPPRRRACVAEKVKINGTKFHFIVGLYPDGRPCELFIEIAKEGSTLAGLVDGFARQFSTSLQHGVPLDSLLNQMRHACFEPSGMTDHPDPNLRFADSIYDFIARWFSLNVVDGLLVADDVDIPRSLGNTQSDLAMDKSVSNSLCPECGGIMQQVGTCKACPGCGATTGCS